jgi:hypothetical protein
LGTITGTANLVVGTKRAAKVLGIFLEHTEQGLSLLDDFDDTFVHLPGEARHQVALEKRAVN